MVEAQPHTVFNRIQYSNPEMDRLLSAAEVELYEARREALLRHATQVIPQDHAILPLYLQNAISAMRAGLTFEARSDDRNDPAMVRSVAR